MPVDELRKNGMMSHLLDALDGGQDIGDNGRLVFAMVAHHFINDDELCQWLCKGAGCDEAHARSLAHQVRQRDYNPPRPEKIRQFQQQQDFPICPTADPDACNVYRDLSFPNRCTSTSSSTTSRRPKPARER
jgi:hypothetical protein